MSVKKVNGRFRVDFWHYFPDGSRKRIRKYSPINKSKDAKEYEEKLKRLAKTDEYWDKSKKEKIPTFLEYQAEFMDQYARAHNKPLEIVAKERTLKNHLIPFFGKYRLDKIRVQELKRYQNTKLKEKTKNGKHRLCAKTINNHTGVMGRILSEAVEMQIITFAPKIKKLPCAPPDFHFLTFEEADALVDGADGIWRNMIALGLMTGLRQGELLGLKWDDIDFENGLLVVRRTVHRGTIGTPKNNKFRSVSLCDHAIVALNELKHRKGSWVFSNDYGMPLTDGQCKWPLIRAYTRAGIQKVTWHMLRHTFASHLVMGNVPIIAVQELLGHATLDMTLRYSHLSPGFAKNEVQVLNRLRHYRDTHGSPNLQVVDFK